MFRTGFKRETEIICTNLKDYLKNTNCNKFVVGLSGGIDSAVVVSLAVNAVGKENVIGVCLPCNSVNSIERTKELADAMQLAENLGIELQVVDISTQVKQYPNHNIKALGNVKARIRMTVLYHIAELNNGLVLGTDNKTESILGYFTKYGDGGVDLLPISSFYKTEVRALAEQLGIPRNIIHRKPTAGLWEGQTDESEIGMSYLEMDTAIWLWENNGDKLPERLEYLHNISHHKRALPVDISCNHCEIIKRGVDVNS